MENANKPANTSWAPSVPEESSVSNEEVLKVLVIIAAEVKAINQNMKTLMEMKQAAPVSAPVQNSIDPKIQKIIDALGEDSSKVVVERKGDQYIVKAKSFLGNQTFAKIATAIKGFGGQYISAGKESHFKVPENKL